MDNHLIAVINDYLGVYYETIIVFIGSVATDFNVLVCKRQ